MFTNSKSKYNNHVILTAVSTSDAVEDARDSSRVIPLQEMDSIIDADMAMLDNNRLHFYRRIDCMYLIISYKKYILHDTLHNSLHLYHVSKLVTDM
jgi:hypothetical protein